MVERPLVNNPLVRSLRDVVGVESWAAQTMKDGADSDGVENPDRRDSWGDPPATFEDSEPGKHDQVGDAPARVEQLDYLSPVTEARPLRSVIRSITAEDANGGRVLVPRDPNRYRTGVKVVGATGALVSHDPSRLFGSDTLTLQSSDGIVWLHGGAELFCRGSGGSARLDVLEELYAIGTRVPDAERPTLPHP